MKDNTYKENFMDKGKLSQNSSYIKGIFIMD